jgi:hypothetical protein
MIREMPTKTTSKEEWSYILIVLKELVSMGFSTVYDRLWKKLWKISFKING